MLGHAPYHQQAAQHPASAAQQQQQQPQSQSQQPPTTIDPADTNALPQHPPPGHPQPPGTFQTLRLRDDPPPVTQPSRSSKKRKSPSSNKQDNNTPNPAPTLPPPQTLLPPPGMPPPHGLPPPHALMHPPPPPHLGGPPIPHGYQYPPQDYSPGGMPPVPPPHGAPMPGHAGPLLQEEGQSPSTPAGRTLSQSKRAEQNRKAQRAFRERRDQSVYVFFKTFPHILSTGNPFIFFCVSGNLRITPNPMSLAPSDTGTSRHLNLAHSSLIPLLLLPTKRIVDGKNVVRWLISFDERTMNCELRWHNTKLRLI